MKLLSVIVTMDPTSGGPAQGIRNNIPFWKQQGIVANILSFDNPTAEFVQQEGIIAIGPTANKWAYVPTAKEWLLQHLPAYDVVLIHGLWLYNGYAVVKAIKQLKRLGKRVPKVFVMPHGMLDPYFQKAPERRLKAIRNVLYWHLIEKKLINSVDGILFTCEEELQLAKVTFNDYRPKTTFNVGYGINPPPLFHDNKVVAFLEKCPQVAGKAYLLFLSRIHPKKGLDILLAAYLACCEWVAILGKEMPLLVIAGPGLDTDYGETLLDFVAAHPLLHGKVYFPGMLQGAAKWGALYGADLFVLPSHQENFGIAIVEAMACKTPVLITNRVNIWREIAEGKGGIVTDDNLQSVTEGLQKWLAMDAMTQSAMGDDAYACYLARFTAEATSRKFVKTISDY